MFTVIWSQRNIPLFLLWIHLHAERLHFMPFISWSISHGKHCSPLYPSKIDIFVEFIPRCGFVTMSCILISANFPMIYRSMISTPSHFDMPFNQYVTSGITIAKRIVYSPFYCQKTYYSMKITLRLPDVSLFYCVVCVIAFVVAYLILPETENISLDDI